MAITNEQLTVAGLVIALASIGATILVPRLWFQSRVMFEPATSTRIGDGPRAPGISVAVLHDGSPVDGVVYAVTGFIENSGGRDLGFDASVDTIELSGPAGAKVLSVDVTAPHGVDCVAEARGGSATLRWRLLKRRERVSITLIVSSTEELPEDGAALKAAIRLRDVAVTGRRRWPRPLLGLLAALVGALAGFIGSWVADTATIPLLSRSAALQPAPIEIPTLPNQKWKCSVPNSKGTVFCMGPFIEARRFLTVLKPERGANWDCTRVNSTEFLCVGTRSNSLRKTPRTFW